MARISMDGGITYMSASEAARFINTAPTKKMNEAEQEKRRTRLWRSVIDCVEPELYREVVDDLPPCTGEEFLEEYLRRAPGDLVIGAKPNGRAE